MATSSKSFKAAAAEERKKRAEENKSKKTNTGESVDKSSSNEKPEKSDDIGAKPKMSEKDFEKMQQVYGKLSDIFAK
jgi:hypothetical protein